MIVVSVAAVRVTSGADAYRQVLPGGGLFVWQMLPEIVPCSVARPAAAVSS